MRWSQRGGDRHVPRSDCLGEQVELMGWMLKTSHSCFPHVYKLHVRPLKASAQLEHLLDASGSLSVFEHLLLYGDTPFRQAGMELRAHPSKVVICEKCARQGDGVGDVPHKDEQGGGCKRALVQSKQDASKHRDLTTSRTKAGASMTSVQVLPMSLPLASAARTTLRCRVEEWLVFVQN